MTAKNDFCPKVSIVIPVYNGANYLGEAIDCALAQTYENLEIIVVNDGSCDDGATEQIALAYGDKIRYFNKENGGVSSALNLGIRHMTGEYFSWLSHDDKYEPEKIAHSVEYLAMFQNRERLIALCGGYYINDKSEKIRYMEFDLKKNVVYSGVDVLQYLLTRGVLDACCMLIPKTAFDECGLFNEDLRYNQDALMWYEIFSRDYNLVVNNAQKDVMYRLHASQTSKTRRDLLLRDSYEMSKIIAPTFAKLSDPTHRLLRAYAKRNARLDCVNAVNECIRVGKETGTFQKGDVLCLRLWLLIGKGRNRLKSLYHKCAFKK